MKTKTAVTIALSALMLSSVNIFAADDEGRPERPSRGDRRERMEKIDTNKDAKISREEFLRASVLFDKMDTNGDGFLTPEDRKGRGKGEGRKTKGKAERTECSAKDCPDKDIQARHGRRGPGERPSKEQIAERKNDEGRKAPRGERMKKAGKNENGKVSNDEFRGPSKRFDKIDANGDGVITKKEFKAAGQKHKKSPKKGPKES